MQPDLAQREKGCVPFEMAEKQAFSPRLAPLRAGRFHQFLTRKSSIDRRFNNHPGLPRFLLTVPLHPYIKQ
jgi:hypothetical protein